MAFGAPGAVCARAELSAMPPQASAAVNARPHRAELRCRRRFNALATRASLTQETCTLATPTPRLSALFSILELSLLSTRVPHPLKMCTCREDVQLMRLVFGYSRSSRT